MSNKENKEQKKAELDTETTIADMNVPGFSWYDPKKKSGKQQSVKLTKEEERALIRGAYRAMLPLIASIAVAGIIVFLLAYMWLN